MHRSEFHAQAAALAKSFLAQHPRLRIDLLASDRPEPTEEVESAERQELISGAVADTVSAPRLRPPRAFTSSAHIS